MNANALQRAAESYSSVEQQREMVLLAFALLLVSLLAGGYLAQGRRFFDIKNSPFRLWLENLGRAYVARYVEPWRESAWLKRHALAYWLCCTANGMTTIGLLLSVYAALALAAGLKSTAFVLFVLSCLPDIMDGWIARHTREKFGQSPLWDSTADKLRMIASFGALFWVITHPSLRAWILIAILIAIDLLNFGLNLYHYFQSRKTHEASGALRGRALRAAESVAAKAAGKIKVWAQVFAAGALMYIVVFTSLRSWVMWDYFRMALCVALVAACLSLFGKLRDVLQLQRSRVP